MKLENVVLKIVDVQHRTGKAKATGNPYDFYTIIVVDEEYNRFESTIGRDDLEQFIAADLDKIRAKKPDAEMDVIITPDDRNVKLRLENIRIQ